MAREIIENYPQYLKDFPEIKAISDAQQKCLQTLKSSVRTMLAETKMDTLSMERWGEIFKKKTHQDWLEDRDRAQLQRHSVVTIKELKSILSCWMSEDKFDLTYDRDSMTLKVRTSLDLMQVNQISFRECVPYNMEISYEVVEEL